MLNNIFKKFLLLMISLLLVSCASQKSIAPINAADVHPELGSSRPAQKIDNPITEKQIAVSKAEPVQENVPITLNVQFDTGKANIKPKYHNDIKRLADVMKKYPSTSVIIEGHTDNVGKELVNVKLSYLRAANIKAYLVRKFGIDSSRIRVIGYDYQKPIASNTTAQGRQSNRRGETQIETNVAPNSLFSFFEDSNFPKGGF